MSSTLVSKLRAVAAALTLLSASVAVAVAYGLPASAAPSSTTHSIPGGGMNSGGVTSLCYDATGFSCAGGGYNGTPGQIGGNGWTTNLYWSWGSAGPNGTRHNCTTYAAYRLQQNGYAYPGWTDNATNWDTQASNHGVIVDQTPAVGAIAQWNAGTGHVAYVESVTDTYIETTSDSYGGGTDHLRIQRSSGYMPDNFIHFRDGGGSIADGSFVQVSGLSAIYRIVGGAPLYVSTWSAVGGAQPYSVISQAQFNALRPFPADGTFLADTSDGRVYETAGGAPLYVSAGDATKVPGYGAKPVWGVDHYDLANLNHLRQFPTDGSLIANVDDGRVYRVAGGAPLYVSASDATKIPGWGSIPTTATSGYEFSAYEHLRRYPADGTFVDDVDDGRVYKVAGGAPLYVSSGGANSVPGYAGGVVIPMSHYEFYAYEHLRRYPADGTAISAAQNGRVYVVAGGAPFYVDAWVNVGGARSVTVVDEWDLDNRADATAHLRTAPVAGTLVGAEPSGTHWLFGALCRSRTASSAGAVAVTDAGAASYPSCGMASLSHAQSSSTVMYGKTAALSATLIDRTNAQKLGAATIELQRKSGSSWIGVHTATTNALGVTGVRVAPSRTTTYRWHVAARTTSTTHYQAAASGAFVIKVRLAAKTPTIRGTARAGHKLTAHAGTWMPTGVKFKYQWFVGGKPVHGATKLGLRLAKAWVGKSVRVRITGSKSGLVSVVQKSAAKKIAK